MIWVDWSTSWHDDANTPGDKPVDTQCYIYCLLFHTDWQQFVTIINHEKNICQCLLYGNIPTHKLSSDSIKWITVTAGLHRGAVLCIWCGVTHGLWIWIMCHMCIGWYFVCPNKNRQLWNVWHEYLWTHITWSLHLCIRGCMLFWLSGLRNLLWIMFWHKKNNRYWHR